ncbi:hypothetical protein [Tsukamurella pseudospumae]|uniref:Scaffolding protein n=1 Tax=Tsukamurella pseudospumae TaxID=239498 RepID=A0A137ZKD3_9ACTN|nr:hypothetical protein [Tsukamurella pseudospumae]KXO98623.1 hypothetical protein AXK61_03310 [Tsukamurella pseudospumae]
MTEQQTTTEETLQQTEGQDGVDQTDPTEGGTPDEHPSDEQPNGDTFPRTYVEQLRQENGKYRQDARDAAARADGLAQRLHTALVAATGKLADPTDLPFDTAHLEDDGVRLAQAIDDLLSSKPHLAARKVSGDVGQGRNSPSSFSLLDAMKGIR